MDWKRMFRHLRCSHRALRAAFPAPVLLRIEQAVRASEKRHGGEVRFAVEGGLELRALWRGQTARQRAVEVFSRLRVWDTEHNNGVLIYVQWADRKLEILADRGIATKVTAAEWRAVCARMELAFRDGAFERGALAALEDVTLLLETHFPCTGERPNELPDRPVVL